MSVSSVSSNGVFTLTLCNERRANALSAPMVTSLMSALDSAEKDPSVRVVVITGSGKYFCSGMDLAATSAASGDKPAFYSSLTIFERIATFPKPTVARVNGGALGGGVGIAFCCDIRIADSDKAYFQLAEVRRGLIPAIISLYIVPQLGLSKSRQYFLTGEKVSPAAMLSSGCLTAVATTDRLDETIATYTKMLVLGGPKAQQAIKQLVASVGDAGTSKSRKVMGVVQKTFEDMLESEEAAHGMQAFLAKEQPDWVKVESKL